MADRNSTPGLAQPDRKNWAISTEQQGIGLYRLSLMDTRFFNNPGFAAESIGAVSGIDVSHAVEFAFNVNPKSLSLDEPAAVQIIPTQDGQYVEHQGQIYKNISISGTTGMRPNRTKPGGIIPVILSNTDFATNPTLDPATNLPKGETTGFDDLIALRNLFRLYCWAKTQNHLASTTVFVWQNGKEGEYYVVEPLSFRTDRDASSPLTFNYQLQLRTIERLDLHAYKLPDPLKTSTSLSSVVKRVNDASRALQADFTVIQSLASLFVGSVGASLTAITSPLNVLLSSLTNVITASTDILAVPRNTVSQIVDNSLALADSLELANAQVDAYQQFGQMTLAEIGINTLRNISRHCLRVYNEDSLFKPSINQSFTNKAGVYRDPVTGSPPNSGDLLNPDNIKAPAGAGVATINYNEDIRQLAQRLLGDISRWKDIALLNNLKSPYISLSGDGIYVLRPGDRILYPAASTSITTAVSPTLGQQVLDPAIALLGIDIRLASDGLGTFDFAIQNGDLDVISGMDNMSQAIYNRFATEPNTLPTHPAYGFLFPIGTKPTYNSITSFKLAGKASLLDDSRISDVTFLTLQATGNTLNVNCNCVLNGLQSQAGASFTVRR